MWEVCSKPACGFTVCEHHAPSDRPAFTAAVVSPCYFFYILLLWCGDLILFLTSTGLPLPASCTCLCPGIIPNATDACVLSVHSDASPHLQRSLIIMLSRCASSLFLSLFSLHHFHPNQQSARPVINKAGTLPVSVENTAMHIYMITRGNDPEWHKKNMCRRFEMTRY